MSDISVVPPPPTAPVQDTHPGSFPRRVADVFLSPVNLFARFGARPPWIDVLLVSTIVGAVVFAFIPREVWVATAQEAMRSNAQAAQSGMDPAAMAGVQRIFGIVAAVVMPWIFLPIQAGILTLLFTVFMGGNATFRQYVSVVAHAGLIGTLGALVQLPIMIQKQSVQAGITLGSAVPGLAQDSFAFQFLNAFNVFLVWSIVVMALGVAALNPGRVSPGKAVGVLLGLFTAIAAGVAAIF